MKNTKMSTFNRFRIFGFIFILIISCRFMSPSSSTEAPSPITVEPSETSQIPQPVSTGNDAIPQSPATTFPGFVSLQIPERKISDNPTSIIKVSEWQKEEGFGNINLLPNQQLIVNNYEDFFIQSWDFVTGNSLFKFESGKTNYKGITNEIYYSSDGSQIVSLYKGGAVQAWDTNTGKWLYSFNAQKGNITGIGYTSDGWQAAIDTKENAIIELWNLGANKLIRSIETDHKNEIYAAFSSDGQLLATSSRDDRVVKVWNLQTGQLLYQLSDQFFRNAGTLIFSPNSKQLIVVDAYGYSNVWSMTTGELLYELSGDLYLGPSPVYSSDGNLIAIRMLITDNNHNGKYLIALINADDGKQLATIESESDITKIIGFTPDEKLLLVDAENNTLQIWGSSK